MDDTGNCVNTNTTTLSTHDAANKYRRTAWYIVVEPLLTDVVQCCPGTKANHPHTVPPYAPGTHRWVPDAERVSSWSDRGRIGIGHGTNRGGSEDILEEDEEEDVGGGDDDDEEDEGGELVKERFLGRGHFEEGVVGVGDGWGMVGGMEGMEGMEGMGGGFGVGER